MNDKIEELTKLNIECAKLDGWTQIKNTNSMAIGGIWRGYPPQPIIGEKELLPDYINSYDDIIPLIKKQYEAGAFESSQFYKGLGYYYPEIRLLVSTTPLQLATALIKALGINL